MDRDQALSDYDAGKFLHSATGGGDFRPSSFYGETLIPKGVCGPRMDKVAAARRLP